MKMKVSASFSCSMKFSGYPMVTTTVAALRIRSTTVATSSPLMSGWTRSVSEYTLAASPKKKRATSSWWLPMSVSRNRSISRRKGWFTNTGAPEIISRRARKGFPIDPSSSTRFTWRMASCHRQFSCTKKGTPARAQPATIRSADSSERAMGFWQMTGRPRDATRRTCSSCDSGAVMMSTKSSFSRRSSSPGSS